MKLGELLKTDFRAGYVNVRRNHWKDGESWSCIGMPKEYHLFLYLDGCDATYTMRDGTRVSARAGDIMYVPSGCEYRAVFTVHGAGRSTVGVNFTLSDPSGEPIRYTDGIYVASGEEVRGCMERIEMLSYSLADVPLKYNLELYKIFNRISDGSRCEADEGGLRTIRAGVEYLHKHYYENVSVGELSDMCHVSEVYFRRLFKMHTGKTPTEYRTHLRLQRALELLRYGSLPVADISQRLGFSDSAYFVKIFKESYGVTPLAYKRQKF